MWSWHGESDASVCTDPQVREAHFTSQHDICPKAPHFGDHLFLLRGEGLSFSTFSPQDHRTFVVGLVV